MRRIVLGVGGVALVALLFGGLATGVATAQNADAGTNASFGAEVSSFMQASGAETRDELDGEMFDAALNRTEDPEDRAELIEERQQRLEERHQELRSQRDALDGEPTVRKRALATRVAVGANGLERSVNNTEKAAMEAGVDTERLVAIRSNASELRGADVSELAKGVVDLPGESAHESPDDVPAENRSIVSSSEENPLPTESAAARSDDDDVREAERAEPSGGHADESPGDPTNGNERGSPPGIGSDSGGEPGAPAHDDTLPNGASSDHRQGRSKL